MAASTIMSPPDGWTMSVVIACATLPPLQGPVRTFAATFDFVAAAFTRSIAILRFNCPVARKAPGINRPGAQLHFPLAFEFFVCARRIGPSFLIDTLLSNSTNSNQKDKSVSVSRGAFQPRRERDMQRGTPSTGPGAARRTSRSRQTGVVARRYLPPICILPACDPRVSNRQLARLENTSNRLRT
jgi:hypothetical protein